MTAPNKISSLNVTRLLPKSRRDAAKIAIVLAIIVAIGGAVPLPRTFAKTATIPFNTNSQKSAELELGETKIIENGSEGIKTINVSSSQSLWGLIFGLQPIRQKETSSTIMKQPVHRIVAHGTKKYQYMLCSDGSYRYYSDEEFKEPQNGFTSKSADSCKESNHGNKVSLANTPPTSGTSSISNTASSSQSDTYEADKIDRETAKLNWCSQEDGKASDTYIGKVHQAQSMQGITNEEFNAIVDPAYFQYSNQVKSLNASGCTISVSYPNYTR